MNAGEVGAIPLIFINFDESRAIHNNLSNYDEIEDIR